VEIKPAVLSSPLFGALTIGGSGDDRRGLLTIRVLRLLGIRNLRRLIAQPDRQCESVGS